MPLYTPWDRRSGIPFLLFTGETPDLDTLFGNCLKTLIRNCLKARLCRYPYKVRTSAAFPEITKTLNCLFVGSSKDAYRGRAIP